MGTTADKLNKVLATKNDLKAALIEKGQDPGDIFSQYPAKVRAIKTDSIKLSSIEITKQPNKTTYSAFESFSSAGMEVKAVFTNDAYKIVSNYAVEPSGQLKATDTKVKVKYEEFGVAAEADIAITVAPIKLNVPSNNKTLTYTGSVLTPTWSGYDSSLMTVSGNTSGTNAGTYTATFTLKDKVNYRWSDGSTSDKSVNWTIGKASVAIPTANNTSFTYSGSAATLSLSNYDSALVSASGISATNAGNYTATFALKDSNNYQWSDGTTANKTIAWVINKAQASITLDKTSVILNADKPTDTVTFSSVGMKSVIAISSDTNVATISVSGDVITISSVNETSGTANIILSGEVDSNYNAPEYPSIAVEAVFAFPVTVCIRSTSDLVPAPYSTVKAIIGDQTVAAPSLDVFNGTVLTGTVIRLEISNSMTNSTAKVEINGELVSDASITTSDVHVYEYEVEGETLIELVPATRSGTARIYNEVSTFYIDDEEYKFVGSPIWSSWLPTVWNTTGMTANGLGIYNADGSLALYTDSIVAGARYTRCTNMVSISIAGKGWQALMNNVRGTAASLYFLGATFADARECMAPAGITIKFYSAYSYGQSGGGQGGYIYFNGEVVAGNGTGAVSYEYVLTDPIYVELKSAVTSNYGSLGCGGTVKIIEASKKRNLTITGSGNSLCCYIRVGGTKYYNPAEVATVIGSLVECYVEDKSDGSSAIIALNGSTVQSGETASYDYTVVRDTDIALSYTNKQGQIHITEK